MNKNLIILLLLIYPSLSFAKGFFFGAELNAIAIDEKSYTGKETREIVKKLNGQIRQEKTGTFLFGLYEGYSLNENIAFISKQRYFSIKYSSDFYYQQSLNFEVAKNVVPINAGIKILFRLDETFGFYLEILPGIYIIDSFESGYFNSYHKRDISFGTNLGLGGDFVIKERINLGIGLIYDWFSINKNNIILEDGGDGGGIGIAFKLGTSF